MAGNTAENKPKEIMNEERSARSKIDMNTHSGSKTNKLDATEWRTQDEKGNWVQSSTVSAPDNAQVANIYWKGLDSPVTMAVAAELNRISAQRDELLAAARYAVKYLTAPGTFAALQKLEAAIANAESKKASAPDNAHEKNQHPFWRKDERELFEGMTDREYDQRRRERYQGNYDFRFERRTEEAGKICRLEGVDRLDAVISLLAQRDELLAVAKNLIKLGIFKGVAETEGNPAFATRNAFYHQAVTAIANAERGEK